MSYRSRILSLDMHHWLAVCTGERERASESLCEWLWERGGGEREEIE